MRHDKKFISAAEAGCRAVATTREEGQETARRASTLRSSDALWNSFEICCSTALLFHVLNIYVYKL